MAQGFVDLRSDTVTRPTPEMRRAMAEAEVGDDAYGEDPTVNRLEEVFAERVGKEAALFVPSGTMANQIALRLLAPPASLVVIGRRHHIVIYESGASARNSGAQLHPVDDGDGTLDPADVAAAVEAAVHHQTRPGLVCVENTHMPSGGRPWPLERLRQVVFAGAGLPVYMDGARLFNAEVATGIPAADYAGLVTAVMCTLSKGLAAPVGSVLAGPAGFVEAAREERHRLGGGMRQAGVIAAAGLVGLTTMVERLADDHERARRLADVVASRWPDGGCRPDEVVTNMVVWRHPAPDALLVHLEAEGVLAGTLAPGVVRLVTHNDVDDDGVERAIKALASAP